MRKNTVIILLKELENNFVLAKNGDKRCGYACLEIISAIKGISNDDCALVNDVSVWLKLNNFQGNEYD